MKIACVHGERDCPGYPGQSVPSNDKLKYGICPALLLVTAATA